MELVTLDAPLGHCEHCHLRGELLDELRRLPPPYIQFAYCDYGGTFLDRFYCQFYGARESTPTRGILRQSSAYYGETAVVYGEWAERLLPCLADYPFPDAETEDAYWLYENEAKRESVDWFCGEYGYGEDAKEWILEHLADGGDMKPDGTFSFSADYFTRRLAEEGFAPAVDEDND